MNDCQELTLQVSKQMHAARAELQKAEEFARSREVAWIRLSQALDEIRSMAAT